MAKHARIEELTIEFDFDLSGIKEKFNQTLKEIGIDGYALDTSIVLRRATFGDAVNAGIILGVLYERFKI